MFKRITPIFLLVLSCCCVSAADLKTRNVFLIVSDGLRWQEVFNGADAQFMTSKSGVKNTNALQKEFWRETPEARRETLLPFIWQTVATRGQILGNQAKGSVVSVSNGRNFSYPGYNEMLTGIPDPRIDSNDKKPNPNINVFEWLNTRRGLRGKVAVFASWDVFPYIFNVERSRLPIWPAWEPQFKNLEIKVPSYLPALVQDMTPEWEDVIHDAFVFEAAMSYVKSKAPRVVFVGFGETDEWAHSNRYDVYLRAAHHMDEFVGRLWQLVQSKPQYRDKTTFIITADHGRGATVDDWQGHGEKVPDSKGDWLAVIGPDTPPLGERQQSAPYVHAQIAATIAALLGHDFHGAFPQTGASIQELIGR